MKTIIGTQTDVIKELTAQVADVLARKPEANIAISAVDLPTDSAGAALAAADLRAASAAVVRREDSVAADRPAGLAGAASAAVAVRAAARGAVAIDGTPVISK